MHLLKDLDKFFHLLEIFLLLDVDLDNVRDYQLVITLSIEHGDVFQSQSPPLQLTHKFHESDYDSYYHYMQSFDLEYHPDLNPQSEHHEFHSSIQDL